MTPSNLDIYANFSESFTSTFNTIFLILSNFSSGVYVLFPKTLVVATVELALLSLFVLGSVGLEETALDSVSTGFFATAVVVVLFDLFCVFLNLICGKIENFRNDYFISIGEIRLNSFSSC